MPVQSISSGIGIGTEASDLSPNQWNWFYRFGVFQSFATNVLKLTGDALAIVGKLGVPPRAIQAFIEEAQTDEAAKDDTFENEARAQRELGLALFGEDDELADALADFEEPSEDSTEFPETIPELYSEITEELSESLFSISIPEYLTIDIFEISKKILQNLWPDSSGNNSIILKNASDFFSTAMGRAALLLFLATHTQAAPIGPRPSSSGRHHSTQHPLSTSTRHSTKSRHGTTTRHRTTTEHSTTTRVTATSISSTISSSSASQGSATTDSFTSTLSVASSTATNASGTHGPNPTISGSPEPSAKPAPRDGVDFKKIAKIVGPIGLIVLAGLIVALIYWKHKRKRPQLVQEQIDDPIAFTQSDGQQMSVAQNVVPVTSILLESQDLPVLGDSQNRNRVNIDSPFQRQSDRLPDFGSKDESTIESEGEIDEPDLSSTSGTGHKRATGLGRRRRLRNITEKSEGLGKDEEDDEGPRQEKPIEQETFGDFDENFEEARALEKRRTPGRSRQDSTSSNRPGLDQILGKSGSQTNLFFGQQEEKEEGVGTVRRPESSMSRRSSVSSGRQSLAQLFSPSASQVNLPLDMKEEGTEEDVIDTDDDYDDEFFSRAAFSELTQTVRNYSGKFKNRYPNFIGYTSANVIIMGLDQKNRTTPYDLGRIKKLKPELSDTRLLSKGYPGKQIVDQQTWIYDAHKDATERVIGEFSYNQENQTLAFLVEGNLAQSISPTHGVYPLPGKKWMVPQWEARACTYACALMLVLEGLTEEEAKQRLAEYTETHKREMSRISAGRSEMNVLAADLERITGRKNISYNQDKHDPDSEVEGITKLKSMIEQNGPCVWSTGKRTERGHARILDAIEVSESGYRFHVRDPFHGSYLVIRDHHGLWSIPSTAKNPNLHETDENTSRAFEAVFLTVEASESKASAKEVGKS